MTYETLLFDHADGIATITLNRPDVANALNMTMARELMDAALRCDDAGKTRAVLLTGTGAMFCAGGDLKYFQSVGAERINATLKEVATYLHVAISHFQRMRAPLVIAVNGTAAGAGMSLAISGDLVLAAEAAKFTMAYTAAGLSPDGSSSYFLPRLVGLRRAQELMITNRRLSAAEALDWGIVTQVVSDDELADAARSLTARLAAGPTGAYGMVKSLLIDTYDNSLESQMELEGRGIADMAAGADGSEGIQAFIEKRKPVFTGT
jgi:2-(1,2-epoxy-1,2-dihydrophenyl)acetyl-CoA isomerase